MEKYFARPYVLSVVIALSAIGIAAAYWFFAVSDSFTPERAIPILGKPGDTHTHVSLLVMIGDNVVNFCDPKYMLKSPFVHFEDDNCFVIHKHATGVTLATFLKTLDVELTSSCLAIPGEEKRCSDTRNTLRVMINGMEFPVTDLSYYELRNNDHILINYGPEKGMDLKLKYNQVPSIPLDINEPLVGL